MFIFGMILGFILGVLFLAFVVAFYYFVNFYKNPDSSVGDTEYWSTDDMPEAKILKINKIIKKIFK